MSLAQQPLLSLAQQSLPNWPNIYKFADCDHVDERIKIRIIAQIKFMSWSKMIEKNMNQGIVRKVSTKFSKDI